MSRKTYGARPGRVPARAGVLVLATATTALCGAAGAFAQAGSGAASTTTTTSTTSTTATGTTTSNDGTTSGGSTATASGSGGGMRLIAEAAHPGKAFTYGDQRITYTFTLDGDRSKDLKIQAVKRKNWKTVKVWRRDNVKPGTHKVRWNGITNKGKAASKGAYLFRIRTKRDRDIDRTRSKSNGGDRSVKLYPAKFPVRARHTYGDGYGAPRAGHVHQGQDILAKCGKRVVAAKGGRVQYRAYQPGGAGNYVVIDARADPRDYVYMHLKRRGPRKGTRVHTGETIGRVGQTGDATACHLHFEIWSRPGWYEGGHAMRSVTKKLKEWDHWS